jgi:hypothetical protein
VKQIHRPDLIWNQSHRIGKGFRNLLLEQFLKCYLIHFLSDNKSKICRIPAFQFKETEVQRAEMTFPRLYNCLGVD